VAIPAPEPGEWALANAQQLRLGDREVLRMIRDAYKEVNVQLNELIERQKAGELLGSGVRRAQLEHTRGLLLAKQADVFDRLGEIVKARRLRAASRSAGLSADADKALLDFVGAGDTGEVLKRAALAVSERQVEVAMARMGLSQLPLAKRIYNTRVWMDGRLGRLINATLASGLNAKEFAKRARDWFNPSTPGGVRYAALRLARTEINNAFHALSVQKAADTPWIPNMGWNLSKSHPKKDICNVVAERDTGQGPGIYKSEAVPVRPHPQCMCYVTPEPIGEDEFVENFLAGEYDDFLDAELDKEDARLGIKKEGTPDATGAATKDARATRRTLQAPDLEGADQPQPAILAFGAGAATGQEALDAAPLGIERNRSTWPAGFSAQMRRSLDAYTADRYREINRLLRGQDLQQEEDRNQTIDLIKEMDAAFALDSALTTQDALVYRGIHSANLLFGDRLSGNLEGLEWAEEAYLSTTAVEARTRTFRGGGEQSVVMRILLPKGTRAIEGSPLKAEAELLVTRGSKMRVVKDHGPDADGIRRIDVELMKVAEEKPASSEDSLPKTQKATLDKLREIGRIEPGVQRQGINLNAIGALRKKGLVRFVDVDGKRMIEAVTGGVRTPAKPKFDQKGFEPGGWAQLADNEDEITGMMRDIKQVMPKEAQADNEAKLGPNWLRQLAEQFMEGTVEPDEVRYSNGPHKIRFSGTFAKNSEAQKRFLAEFDLMQSLFPTGHDMRIHVAPSDQFGRGVGGETTISTGSMFVNERYLDRDRVWRGMPISSEFTASQYILAHEWGHSLSTKDEADEAHTHNHAIEAGGMTTYGTHDHNGVLTPREGYAEAFAEWSLSRGKTTNPATLVYAERFKWGERFGFE
jgi:hypothetical protein